MMTRPDVRCRGTRLCGGTGERTMGSSEAAPVSYGSNEDKWVPLYATVTRDIPDGGTLLAVEHAVWRVVRVATRPLDEDSIPRWQHAGMPDLDTWRDRPYWLHAEHVGGVLPHVNTAPDQSGSGSRPLHVLWLTDGRQRWYVYDRGRWPQCSCCSEPMPCRAEIEDRKVHNALSKWDRMAGRVAGCCWFCEEPISHRQASVAYPGDNLDLPGGPSVAFHTRRQCWYAATLYELRWLAGDPRRERILTWPTCGASLIVHHDGSSQCAGGPNAAPDCRGHLTHEHGSQSACYSYALFHEWSCPYACPQKGHPGIRTTHLNGSRGGGPARHQPTLPITPEGDQP